MSAEQELLHRAWYLTGATASGKTAVGVAVARRIGAEVVAMDSMTLYRGMDVGTAKPTAAEREEIPHHLIDVIDPWEAASVAEYRRWAVNAATAIEARGNRVLFVGGTALYLKALLRGLFEGPSADPALRQSLTDEAERVGGAAMHQRLLEVDPIAAARLHPNDRRRVVRALEVIAATGRPLSSIQVEHDRPAPGAVTVLALDRPRGELHERINVRVHEMFANGLVEEVRRLRDADRPLNPVPAQGVGYREVLSLLAGELTEAEAVEKVQARTRQFAKRQSTWFRGLEEVELWPVGLDESVPGIAERIVGRFERDEG